MRQYQRLIYTVCLQFVHDPHTAEDLTQETFLSAFGSIDRCEPAYHKQWLVRVAANKCKDHLKSAWVRKVETHEQDTLPEPHDAPPPGTALQSVEPDPQDAFLRQENAEELDALIRGLREPYGKVATMYLIGRANRLGYCTDPGQAPGHGAKSNFPRKSSAAQTHYRKEAGVRWKKH